MHDSRSCRPRLRLALIFCGGLDLVSNEVDTLALAPTMGSAVAMASVEFDLMHTAQLLLFQSRVLVLSCAGGFRLTGVVNPCDINNQQAFHIIANQIVHRVH